MAFYEVQVQNLSEHLATGPQELQQLIAEGNIIRTTKVRINWFF